MERQYPEDRSPILLA